MNKWYVVCSVLVVVIVAQSFLYLDLDRRHANVSSDYRKGQEDLAALQAQYDTLLTDFVNLQSSYTELEADYSDLESWYAEISLQHSVLRTNYSNLETDFQALQGTHDALNDQYAELQADYETLLQQSQDYILLEQRFNTLTSLYNSLQSQYNALQSQYDTLEEEYDNYVSAYQELRDQINERRYHSEVEAFITPYDSSVTATVLSITGGWSNPSDFNEFWDEVKAMYLWIRSNIDYRWDGLYPLLPYDPSLTVTYSTEMWQFANETLDLGKGDCEDQAILLCSMIRNYCNSAYKTECILIHSLTLAHAGVQIPVAGGILVILDPAGNYYSHDILGNIAFRDLTTEINNWLDYWKPEMGTDVHVYQVFSSYISQTFTSTSEYITWMLSR